MNLSQLDDEFQTMMVEKEPNPKYDKAHQKATKKLAEADNIPSETKTKAIRKMAEIKPGEALTTLEQALNGKQK